MFAPLANLLRQLRKCKEVFFIRVYFAPPRPNSLRYRCISFVRTAPKSTGPSRRKASPSFSISRDSEMRASVKCGLYLRFSRAMPNGSSRVSICDAISARFGAASIPIHKTRGRRSSEKKTRASKIHFHWLARLHHSKRLFDPLNAAFRNFANKFQRHVNLFAWHPSRRRKFSVELFTERSNLGAHRTAQIQRNE